MALSQIRFCEQGWERVEEILKKLLENLAGILILENFPLGRKGRELWQIWFSLIFVPNLNFLITTIKMYLN